MPNLTRPELSRPTWSRKSSTSWSGQRDPQTWIRLSICGTSSSDIFQGVRTHRWQYRPSQQPWERSGTASTRSLYAVWSRTCVGNAESVSSPVVATKVIEVCSVHLKYFMGPLKQHGRYNACYVSCVITLLWRVSLIFRICDLPGHEVSLCCVFFSCTCESCTTRNYLFMKLINFVIFTQDQNGDSLNILSSIFQNFTQEST